MADLDRVIDFSNYNGPVAFFKAKRAGLRDAIRDATHGAKYLIPVYKPNRTAVRMPATHSFYQRNRSGLGHYLRLQGPGLRLWEPQRRALHDLHAGRKPMFAQCDH